MFWKLAALASLAALVGVRFQDPPTKIAVLKMSAFNDPKKCSAAGALVEKLKGFEAEVREKAGEKRKEIGILEDKIKGLPANSRTQLQEIEKLENLRAALENYGKASNRIARRLLAEGRASIFREIQKYSADVAAAEGYRLVLKLDEFTIEDTSLEEVSGGIALTSVIWSDAALDITDKVLGKYNKEFKP